MNAIFNGLASSTPSRIYKSPALEDFMADHPGVRGVNGYRRAIHVYLERPGAGSPARPHRGESTDIWGHR